jgi:hypothetical protein
MQECAQNRVPSAKKVDCFAIIKSYEVLSLDSIRANLLLWYVS